MICFHPLITACRSACLLLLVLAILCSLGSNGAEQNPLEAKSSEPKSKFTPQQFERLGERDQIEEHKDQLLRDGKFTDAAADLEKIVAIDREVLGDDHCDTFNALRVLTRVEALDNNQAAAKKSLAELADLQSKGHGAG